MLNSFAPGAGEDSRSLFAEFAVSTTEIQQHILRFEAAPHESKTLRLFPTSEVARLLGLSESHLRAITREREDLPTGTVIGGNNRRAFSLAEINAIRRAMFEHSGDRRWLPHRNPASEKLQVLTVANFKGGAAKTTTAAHLAQYLALRGYRVLAVDLDSQASLTSLFGIQPDLELQGGDTLYPLFANKKEDRRPIDGLVQKTYWDGLDLIPANLQLYQAEFEVPVRYRKEPWPFWRELERSLALVGDRYDVVVCDCPPSLGYLSMNGVYAATSLIVPVPASMMDFASTGQFFAMLRGTIDSIASNEGRAKGFDFVRVLITKFLSNDQSQMRIARWMARSYGASLMEAKMVLTTALERAGTKKETYYESGYSEGSRLAYLRGLEHLDGVNREVENHMLGVWGRAPRAEAA